MHASNLLLEREKRGRALSLCSGNIIGMCDLPAEIASEYALVPSCGRLSSEFPLSTSLASSEQKLIREAITKNNWNVVKTAKMLGVSRAALYEKLKKHRIRRPEKRYRGSVSDF